MRPLGDPLTHPKHGILLNFPLSALSAEKVICYFMPLRNEKLKMKNVRDSKAKNPQFDINGRNNLSKFRYN
jgi:hypothetical protein